MKVAFLAYEYPPYSFGGIGSFSEDLSKGLSSAGIGITVLCLSHLRTITKEIINPNLTIIRVPTINFPPRHLWWQTGNCNLIVNLLTKLDPDLIHSNSLVATLPLRAYRKISETPQIITIHGYNRKILEILLANNKKLLQPSDFFTYVFFEPLYDLLLQMEMESADCAVAVSQHLKSDLQNRFTRTNLKCVYNGIAVEPFFSNVHSTDKCRKDQSVFFGKKRPVRIAYIGRLFWTKGIIYAINAFLVLMRLHHPQDIEFNIYGDGPLKGTVRKLIKSKELSSFVHYHGQLPRNQILIEMRKNDIVLFPSLYEACPMALLEALNLGKTVVVNNMPWSEEFIKNRINGIRLNTCDPVAFADGLFELIVNRELRDRISEKARDGIAKYSISEVTNMYANIYQSLIHSRI